MVDKPTNRDPEVIDPVTKKPLHEERLNSLVRGPEVEPIAMGDEISGPDDLRETNVRSASGTQMIVHINDPDDPKEVKAAIAAAKEVWRQARGQS